MPTVSRYPSWPIVERMLDEGIPQRIRIHGDPLVEILIEPGGERLGLLVPNDEQMEIRSLAFTYMDVQPRIVDGITYLYISTSAQALYAEFFGFITGVADEIQIHKRTFSDSIQRQFADLRTLLTRRVHLLAEEEVGLYGELWTLSKVLSHWGLPGFDAWTGPLDEPHDFRFVGFDLEVKSTRNRKRLHRVSSMEQLVPTDGKDLFVLSLQFQPAGMGGQTLPQAVAEIHDLLKTDYVRQSRFTNYMAEKYGVTSDETFYTSTFELRTLPVIVAAETCPRLTPERVGMITDIRRVSNVEYTIDLEGLGYSQGTSEFGALLPIE